jgi:hypothetical protein
MRPSADRLSYCQRDFSLSIQFRVAGMVMNGEKAPVGGDGPRCYAWRRHGEISYFFRLISRTIWFPFSFQDILENWLMM